jgi:hypothetical protein
MATYNTNSLPEPIYPSIWDTGQPPDPFIGAQTFLGCTVASFNVSSDLQGRGGQLNATLVEDYDASGVRQKLQDTGIYDVVTATSGSLPVVGSPQYFKLLDKNSDTIFEYNGILKSIGRRVTPNGGKTYSATLSGPLSLLQNVTVILDKYAGFGYAQEGIPNINSINSYYQVGSPLNEYGLNHFDNQLYKSVDTGLDKNLTGDVSPDLAVPFDLDINEIPPTGYEVGLSLATNNRSIIWTNVYNIINVFGFYESNSHGFSSSNGYGYSSSTSTGMKLGKVIQALDQLINRTKKNSPQRYFGGNILSGTSTYNICGVRDGHIGSDPYYYGVDFNSFILQLKGLLAGRYLLSGYATTDDPLCHKRASKIVDNYEITQGSTDLGSLISGICSNFGFEFLVNLTKVSYTSGSTTDYMQEIRLAVAAGADIADISSPFNYYGNHLSSEFVLEKTGQGQTGDTKLGGVISILLLDKSLIRCDRPFSAIAYHLLGLEVPNFGDYGLAGKHSNPGIRSPASPAFDLTSVGPSYIDPLDDDYNNKHPEGYTPYGGKFPVETGLSLAHKVLQRAQSTDLSIVNVESVTCKMILGGPVSRIVDIPRKYIYHYWGDINIYPSGTVCDLDKVSSRSHPVVTQLLPHDDIYDHVLIDMKDVLPDNVCQGVAYSGVYSASISEIRMAMSNKGRWRHFLKILKPCKWAAIEACANINESGTMRDIGSLYAVSGVSSGNATLMNQYSDPTYEYYQEYTGSKTPIGAENTSVKSIKPKVSSTDGEYHNSLDSKTLVEKIHQKIKSIGDTHYGKSWFGWVPHMETKVAQNRKEIISSYEKSWTVSDDAYLEPSGYTLINAPQTSKFIKDHKVSAYSNFEYSMGSGLHKFTDAFTETGDVEAFRKEPGNETFYVYDFSEINPETIHISECAESGIAHTQVDIDKKYVNLPYDYFTNYVRIDKPFVSPTGGPDAFLYSQNSSEPERSAGLMGYSMSGDIYEGVPSKAGRTNAEKLANTYLYNSVIATGTHDKNSVIFDKHDVLCDVAKSTHSGSFDKSWETIDKFLDLRFPDNAQDCFHFVKFKTERVFNPLTTAKGHGITDGKIVVDIYRKKIEPIPVPVSSPSRAILLSRQLKQGKSPLDIDPLKDSAFPVCIPPLSIGVPQVSNRYYYGPWVTDNKFMFAGGTEFLHDTSLVPENFVAPVYGELIYEDVAFTGFNYFDDFSGTVGLNNAGKAYANSIDGFKLFANENGTVTLPGAPLIKNIGDALFRSSHFSVQDAADATYILSLSVQATPQGITTTYNFGSNQPRLDSIPKQYADKIQKTSEQAKNRIGHIG